MKIGKDALLMMVILVVGIGLFAVFVGPSLLAGEGHGKGEPNDVSRYLTAAQITGAGRPERGSEHPRYTLVEFGDYQCASCGRAAPVVQDLLKSRADLRFIFRHAPLATGHDFARMAARAAEAAGQQGRYWPMHDALYAHQTEWSTGDKPQEVVTALAEVAGVDGARFRKDMESKAAALDANVERDLAAANACSVTDTPSFFLITPTRIWAAVGPVGLRKLQESSQYWQ